MKHLFWSSPSVCRQTVTVCCYYSTYAQALEQLPAGLVFPTQGWGGHSDLQEIWMTNWRVPVHLRKGCTASAERKALGWTVPRLHSPMELGLHTVFVRIKYYIVCLSHCTIPLPAPASEIDTDRGGCWAGALASFQSVYLFFYPPCICPAVGHFSLYTMSTALTGGVEGPPHRVCISLGLALILSVGIKWISHWNITSCVCASKFCLVGTLAGSRISAGSGASLKLHMLEGQLTSSFKELLWGKPGSFRPGMFSVSPPLLLSAQKEQRAEKKQWRCYFWRSFSEGEEGKRRGGKLFYPGPHTLLTIWAPFKLCYQSNNY